MNDFTKEELEIIYYHLENEPEEIALKIKNMIKNYCEHEHKNKVNNCRNCGVSEYICKRCGLITYEGLE